ncbi:uncharacterized protein [Salmo salar]|uniref:Uncharacterized protein n=1 Tax=Salmo salar TaxID=8030 RepID=A0ABM3FAB0_SALSA|nr:uncharacterized protein LOC123744686 [Salmo salar]
MLYGNKWVKISQLTGRSEITLMKRFSQIFKSSGTWELNIMTLNPLPDILFHSYFLDIYYQRCLNNAPACLVGFFSHKLRSLERGRTEETNGSRARPPAGTGGSWQRTCHHQERQAVQQHPLDRCVPRVKTCHRDQCRMKWLNAMQVEDSADIDWEEIAHTVGGVTPICYVQMHYHKLKVAKVPLQQSMSFCEIIDFLHSSVLPQFEELLCHSQAESGETESRDDRRELFLLSEIFENEDD